MPIASVLGYMKGLLSGLTMPGGEQDMRAYIDAPDPNVETDIPTVYVWPTDIDEHPHGKSGGTYPRNQGPGTPSGFKTITHDVSLYITHVESSDNPEADSLFPGIVDAVMKAMRTAYPMPVQVTDPYDGAVTTVMNVGEAMTGKIIVGALEDEGFLRYDSLLRLSVTEQIQA